MKPESFKLSQPDEPTKKQIEAANKILGDSDFLIVTENGNRDFSPTIPSNFDASRPWSDFDSALDTQLEAADSILDGAIAKPITPGKSDEYKLPKIPVPPDIKPELAKPQPGNSTDNEVRIDQENSPAGRARRRMLEREAKKNEGFFAKLFGRK